MEYEYRGYNRLFTNRDNRLDDLRLYRKWLKSISKEKWAAC